VDTAVADHRVPSARQSVWLPEPDDCECADIDADDSVHRRRTVTSTHGNHGHSRSSHYSSQQSLIRDGPNVRLWHLAEAEGLDRLTERVPNVTMMPNVCREVRPNNLMLPRRTFGQILRTNFGVCRTWAHLSLSYVFVVINDLAGMFCLAA